MHPQLVLPVIRHRVLLQRCAAQLLHGAVPSGRPSGSFLLVREGVVHVPDCVAHHHASPRYTASTAARDAPCLHRGL